MHRTPAVHPRGCIAQDAAARRRQAAGLVPARATSKSPADAACQICLGIMMGACSGRPLPRKKHWSLSILPTGGAARHPRNSRHASICLLLELGIGIPGIRSARMSAFRSAGSSRELDFQNADIRDSWLGTTHSTAEAIECALAAGVACWSAAERRAWYRAGSRSAAAA